MKALAIKAAKKAGSIILKNFGKIRDIREKGIGDIVTNVDIESQRAILQTIQDKFPKHNIIAEESDEINNNSEYTWIIDPLDGTNNYSRSIPFFNVSIALRKNDQIVLGVIYSPFLNELFVAERGKGSTLNGKPIKPSKTADLKRSFLSYCDGHGIEHRLTCLKVLNEFKTSAADIRKIGAAELELAYVACGRIDGFIIFGAKIWDWSAGCLLVEEAGGRVTDLYGNDWSKTTEGIIAANKPLFNELLSKCKKVI